MNRHQVDAQRAREFGMKVAGARMLAAARRTYAVIVALTALTSACVRSEPEPARLPVVRVAKLDRPNMPQATVGKEERAAFARGDALFETMFRAPDGLGPLYVRASCASCHQDDGRGPGLVTRVALPAALQASREAALPFGDVVRPYYSAPATLALTHAEGPPGARFTHRLPPAVFGRGYMEAVDDAEIERLAELAHLRQGPIKGRIHRVRERAGMGAASRIGRFGLKARIATLEEFTADALQGDMGLTSPLRPSELPNPEAVHDDAKPGVDVDAAVLGDLRDYLRLLELPERGGLAATGARLFEAAECAVCHVPRLKTGADYAVRSLAGREVAVYTDFLLHDMGDALADGVQDGDAGGREWRTAPLIGLRFAPALLHDGRVKTVTDAVTAHAGAGSEANGAVDKFAALAPSERAALVAFVERL